MKRWINLILMPMLSVSLLGQQQSDRPVPDDLEGKKAAAVATYRRDIAAIASAEPALTRLAAKDPGGPKAQGAFTQLRMMHCLASGDLARQMAAIYQGSGIAAGQLAHELEVPNNPPDGSMPAVADLQKQLSDTKHREAELQSNPTSTSAAELDELSALEKRLQDALDAYQKIPDMAPNAEQARKMREMESQFGILSQDAAAAAKISDAACVRERQILYYLSKDEQLQGQVDSLSRLLEGSSGFAQAKRPDAGQAVSTESQQEQKLAQRVFELEAELKVMHQQLNDIGALQARLAYLQGLLAASEAKR